MTEFRAPRLHLSGENDPVARVVAHLRQIIEGLRAVPVQVDIKVVPVQDDNKSIEKMDTNDGPSLEFKPEVNQG